MAPHTRPCVCLRVSATCVQFPVGTTMWHWISLVFELQLVLSHPIHSPQILNYYIYYFESFDFEFLLKIEIYEFPYTI